MTIQVRMMGEEMKSMFSLRLERLITMSIPRIACMFKVKDFLSRFFDCHLSCFLQINFLSSDNFIIQVNRVMYRAWTIKNRVCFESDLNILIKNFMSIFFPKIFSLFFWCSLLECKKTFWF